MSSSLPWLLKVYWKIKIKITEPHARTYGVASYFPSPHDQSPPITTNTQTLVLACDQYGICSLISQTSFRLGNRWWRRKMSTIFSAYPTPCLYLKKKSSRERGTPPQPDQLYWELIWEKIWTLFPWQELRIALEFRLDQVDPGEPLNANMEKKMALPP